MYAQISQLHFSGFAGTINLFANPLHLEEQLYFNRPSLDPRRQAGAGLCHSGIKLFYRLKGENKPTGRFCALVLFYFRSHLSLAGAVHHRRRPQDTAVILVQVAVFWSPEVFQHKHVLELAILPVAKFFDIVGFDTGGVYILMKSRSRKCSAYETKLDNMWYK